MISINLILKFLGSLRFRSSTVIASLSALLLSVKMSHAEWSPLIEAADFAGIRTDILTVAGGVVSVLLIVAGLAMLIRAMGR